MSRNAGEPEIDVNPIDESTLTKGQLHKLNALRKSVGSEIGERAFVEWLSSRAEEEKTDRNIDTIAGALWPLVQDGKLQLRRGGYLVRRGRGRLIVEAGEPALAPTAVGDGIGDTEAVERDAKDQREPARQNVPERQDQAQPKRQTWRGLFGGGGTDPKEGDA